MKYLLLLSTVLLLSFISIAEARPVSYADGWTVMQKNDHLANSIHVHYSPTAWYSVGLRAENLRNNERAAYWLQLNNLLWRENTAISQANFYLKSGVGAAEDNSSFRPGAFSGISTDWETRRYFVSYENRLTYANDIEESFMQKARVGIAPYIADFGELHTWLMIQLDHHPSEEDTFVVTPLVRMFKGSYLGEFGINNNGDALINFIVRF